MKLAVGLVFVLISVALLNLSFYGQHAASTLMPKLTLRHPVAATRSLLTSKAWLRSYAAGWVGWGAYIAALGFAPLSIVQGLSASGIGVLALIRHLRGAALSRRERYGAGAATLGLVMLIISLVRATTGHRASELELLLLVGIGLVVATCFAFAPSRVIARGAALGAAAGIYYGVGDAATKGALAGSGLWLVPIFLLLNVLGFVALQLAYQKGTVLETAGLSSLFTNAIPIVVGISIFAERPPAGALGVVRVAGFALALAGGVLLARPPVEPEHEPVGTAD